MNNPYEISRENNLRYSLSRIDLSREQVGVVIEQVLEFIRTGNYAQPKLNKQEQHGIPIRGSFVAQTWKAN